MSNKNEVFEYLIDQLRQQVNNNQREDLAHEVQSLKNQLRDVSEVVDELQGDNIKKSEHISHLTGRVKELTCALDCAENEVMCLRSIVDLDPKGVIGYIRRANSAMTDTMRRQYLSKALEELGCKDAPEQSGCRKEDTQVAEPWVKWEGGECPVQKDTIVQIRMRDGTSACEPGVAGELRWDHRGWRGDITRYRVVKPECEHECRFYNKVASMMCKKCGLNK